LNDKGEEQWVMGIYNPSDAVWTRSVLKSERPRIEHRLARAFAITVCGAYVLVWGRRDAVIAIATQYNIYSTFVT
jgi:hypothetical protein